MGFNSGFKGLNWIANEIIELVFIFYIIYYYYLTKVKLVSVRTQLNSICYI